MKDEIHVERVLEFWGSKADILKENNFLSPYASSGFVVLNEIFLSGIAIGNFKAVYTVNLLNSIASFTKKFHYLSKNTIIRLLPRHVSALLCHLSGSVLSHVT
jgi:hypothetical protein